MMGNRIGRLELLFWYSASTLGAAVILVIVAALTGTSAGTYPHTLPQAIIFIAASILALKAVWSRLHDIGWPGWTLILMFVPFVNVLALLLLMIVPGQKKANAYGAPTVFLQHFRRIGSRQVPD
jgi:uncharacterized membrane protein YhaH (DUF805 family)